MLRFVPTDGTIESGIHTTEQSSSECKRTQTEWYRVSNITDRSFSVFTMSFSSKLSYGSSHLSFQLRDEQAKIDTSTVGNDAFVTACTAVPACEMRRATVPRECADQSREKGGDREECDADLSRQAIDPVVATVPSHDMADM